MDTLKNTSVFNDITLLDDNEDYHMISMDEVEEKEIQWLIPNYIPKEQITLIVGDGGVGKTTSWISIISALSKGELCFFENQEEDKREPLKIGFFSSEDPHDSIIKKKLRLNLAKQSNVKTIPITDKRFHKVKFNSQYLEGLIIENKLEVLVFDPLQSFIGDSVNMGARNTMRSTLNNLIALGKIYHVTIIIIVHTNKREMAGGRNRASDSSDIWDIARSVIFVGDASDEGIHYFSQEKSNYGKLQPTTLFKIEDSVIVKVGTTSKKDFDFQKEKTKGNKKKSLVEEAIISLLNDHDAYSDEIYNLAEELDISKSTLKRARAELTSEGTIKPKRTGSNKGNDKQRTIFSLVKKVQIQRFKKYSD